MSYRCATDLDGIRKEGIEISAEEVSQILNNDCYAIVIEGDEGDETPRHRVCTMTAHELSLYNNSGPCWNYYRLDEDERSSLSSWLATRQAAALMGSAKTPAKARAARLNGMKGGRPAKAWTVVIEDSRGWSEPVVKRYKDKTAVPHDERTAIGYARHMAGSQGPSIARFIAGKFHIKVIAPSGETTFEGDFKV